VIVYAPVLTYRRRLRGPCVVDAASAFQSAYIGRHDFPKGPGEFLLGPDQRGRKKIVGFAYYDDIDPHA